MLFGLPLEVVTMLGSSLFSGIMTMWAQSSKDRADQFKQLIEARTLDNRNQIEQIKVDKTFPMTRRFIAIAFVLAAIGSLYVPALFDIPHIIEVTSSTEGLFGLFKDTVTNYVPVEGFVHPDWLRISIFSIMGLYFGNSIAKR